MDVKRVSEALFETQETEQNLQTIIIPAPWNVADDIGSTASTAPEHIAKCSREASLQNYRAPLRASHVVMAHMDQDWQAENDRLRVQALDCLISRDTHAECHRALRVEVDTLCQKLRNNIRKDASVLIGSGKTVGLLGGDCSTPLGLLDALAGFYNNFSLLHIGARCRLHAPSQLFECTPRHFMKHVLKMPFIPRITQVGMRTCTREEVQCMESEEGRWHPFDDDYMQSQTQKGIPWREVCASVVETLSDRVYISFDLGALAYYTCPNTADPLPGGMSLYQAMELIKQVEVAKKRLIGFDLCQVNPTAVERGFCQDVQMATAILRRLVHVAGASFTRQHLPIVLESNEAV